MPVTIRPNLPPEAMPWARDRDERLAKLEREMARRTNNEANTNASQNSSMNLLSKQVAALAVAIDSTIAPSFNQNGTNNFDITTTSSTVETVTFTVPDGYTRAMVFATAEGMGVNGTASGDYLYVQANVDGIAGGELYSYAGPGIAVGLSALLYWELSGLEGGDTFPVSTQVRSGNALWPQNVANAANIYALVVFLR